MNPEKELLEPIENDEKSKFFKIIWKIVGIALIILTLSYMLTGYTVRNIIAGKADSQTIKDNTIKSDYGNIILTNEVYEELKSLYHTNEKEFRACLKGEYKNNNYNINTIYLPKIHFQDYDKVISEQCPLKTLLDMHSHPQQHCIFSEIDINGFTPVDEDTLLTVMCGDDRFIFYKKNI